MTSRILIVLVGLVFVCGIPALAAGPFSDVPKGHWSHQALRRAVDSGILQGDSAGKFAGARNVTRYEMATVVARMLDAVDRMPAGKAGGKTLVDLEALAIEFSDELALLNVKVGTLEDAFAEARKDVDALKSAQGTGGAKAGISGLFQVRFAGTGEDPNGLLGRGVGRAATGPVARYVGGIPGNAALAPGVANTVTGVGRRFFDVAQSSLAFDRRVDDELLVHLQLDVDADNEAGFANGNSLQLNEAYVELEKLVADGDLRLRVGAWALPFSRERNPEMADSSAEQPYGFRTLDLTVTPALSDQTWEQVRLLGVGLRNRRDAGVQWQAGVTNSPGAGAAGLVTADGSLLTYRGARVNNAINSMAQNDAFGLAGRGLGQAVWGDALQGIDPWQPSGRYGFYGWVGDRNQSGFRWDAGYFSNGGELAPGAGDLGTGNDWSGLQLNAGWWGWKNWGLMASYFAATSASNNGAGVAVGASAGAIGSGLVTGALPAGVAYPDLESRALSLLVNYRVNADNDLTVRYEDARDEFGPADVEARIWTLGWNHRLGAGSLLQLEYSLPETESLVAAPTAAGYSTTGFVRNTADANDDLLLLNYKVKF